MRNNNCIILFGSIDERFSCFHCIFCIFQNINSCFHSIFCISQNRNSKSEKIYKDETIDIVLIQKTYLKFNFSPPEPVWRKYKSMTYINSNLLYYYNFFIKIASKIFRQLHDNAEIKSRFSRPQYCCKFVLV